MENKKSEFWITSFGIAFTFFYILKRLLIKKGCLLNCCNDLFCQSLFYEIRGVVSSILLLLLIHFYFRVKVWSWPFLVLIVLFLAIYHWWARPILPETAANLALFAYPSFSLLATAIIIALLQGLGVKFSDGV